MIPLFNLLRLAGPDRCLIGITGFIQCCNVTNSIVPFFPFQGFFVAATTTIFWCQTKAPPLPPTVFILPE